MGTVGSRWRRWCLLGSVGLVLVAGPGCRDSVTITGIEEGDRFVQEGGHAVTDVLWVIDDSGTMSEEQETLKASFQDFVDTLAGADIDFHMGVITTDVSDSEQAGILLGEPPVLVNDTQDLAEVFAERAAVGIDGSPDERGFDAVTLALSEPRVSGANAGFLRDEAALDIIIVSDEDDHSSQSVSDFLAFLASVKPSGAFRVSALVGDVPYGCAASSGAADPAPRYLEAAEETEGVTQSICAASYDQMMERLVMILAGLRDTFPLSRIADPDTIEVRVDGIIIRNREEDGWQYLPALNAVRIVGTPFPEPGQEVVITYDTLRF